MRAELDGPAIALATAHPAKFPAAIAQAIGRAAKIPPSLAGLGERTERVTVLPNSTAAVKEFILEQTRKR